MAVVNREEFASMCKMDIKKLNVYIGRGKVILVNPNVKKYTKIDTENIINKAFFKKWSKYVPKERVAVRKVIEEPIVDEPIVDNSELAEKVIHKVTKRKAPVKRVAKKKLPSEDLSSPIYGTTKKETAAEKRAREKSNKESEIMFGLESRKKVAEVLKLEREAEKALLMLHKLNGEMLPTDFVKRMIVDLVKTILSVFGNEMDNLAGVYCDELAGGDRAALAKVNQKLSETYQSVINSAKDIANKQMKVTISEFSVKKGKGERN